MKISILSAGKTGLGFTGIIFIATIIGAGSANAETYQHGGSTATIHQSGGSGNSQSQVTRYQDGQRIITQDGSSTDITIQREGRFLAPDNREEYPEIEPDCFERRFMEERFSRIEPDNQSDDFKQRMLDRIRRYFLP